MVCIVSRSTSVIGSGSVGVSSPATPHGAWLVMAMHHASVAGNNAVETGGGYAHKSREVALETSRDGTAVEIWHVSEIEATRRACLHVIAGEWKVAVAVGIGS